MSLIPSIHETQVDAIVRTHHQSDIARSSVSTPDINIELYSAGFFSGLTGLNAELPHFSDYWLGYALGYREYCCGLLGVEVSTSEIIPKD